MDPQVLSLKEGFDLESGQTIDRVHLAYHTWGTLNADKSNVIMVAHALTANSDLSDWWSGLFGPGNVFDPEKYFIVCPNNLGSPYGSLSPLSTNPISGRPYGQDFPFFTIRDTARLHIRFLKELNLRKLHFLIGPSCGGNIAQEIAIYLGRDLSKLALLCCSAKERPWVIAIHEAQRQAICSDPAYNTGGKITHGLRAARGMAMPLYRSHSSFNRRQQEDTDSKVRDFRAASYIDYQGRKFESRFDARAYVQLLNALDTHNVGRSRDGVEVALEGITAETLCMSFSSDILVPPLEQKFLSEKIPGSLYHEVESDYGHDSFLIELDKIRPVLLDFLKPRKNC